MYPKYLKLSHPGLCLLINLGSISEISSVLCVYIPVAGETDQCVLYPVGPHKAVCPAHLSSFHLHCVTKAFLLLKYTSVLPFRMCPPISWFRSVLEIVANFILVTFFSLFSLLIEMANLVHWTIGSLFPMFPPGS